MVTLNADEINTGEICDPNMVQGKAVMTKKVIMPPLEMVEIKEITKMKGYSQRLNVIVEPLESSQILLVNRTYTCLKARSS